MIRSMTGYSRVRGDEADFSVSVSAKATNHRSLDLQIRVPTALEPIEPLLRRMVKEHVARGHVELTVTLERTDSIQLQLNRKMVGAYATACRTGSGAASAHSGHGSSRKRRFVSSGLGAA